MQTNMMRFLLLLAVTAYTAGCATFSTITGNVVDITGNPIPTNSIYFESKSTPLAATPTVLPNYRKTVLTDTNGDFTVQLYQGNYSVTIRGVGGWRDTTFGIAVPSASATYALTDLITNTVAWTQSVLPQYVLKTTLTNKGDLLGRNATNTARFPVGTSGQYLRVNPAAEFGYEWSSVSAGSGATVLSELLDTDINGGLADGDILKRINGYWSNWTPDYLTQTALGAYLPLNGSAFMTGPLGFATNNSATGLRFPLKNMTTCDATYALGDAYYHTGEGVPKIFDGAYYRSFLLEATNGNWGLNKVTPREKLEVGGKVRAEGYKGTNGTDGATGTNALGDAFESGLFVSKGSNAVGGSDGGLTYNFSTNDFTVTGLTNVAANTNTLATRDWVQANSLSGTTNAFVASSSGFATNITFIGTTILPVTVDVVSNGTFTVDYSGWTAQNATLSIVTNMIKITALTASSSRAQQSVQCEPGAAYLLSFNSKNGNGANKVVVYGASVYSTIDCTGEVGDTNHTVWFTVPSSDTFGGLVVQLFVAGSGKYGYFDNVQLHRLGAISDTNNSYRPVAASYGLISSTSSVGVLSMSIDTNVTASLEYVNTVSNAIVGMIGGSSVTNAISEVQSNGTVIVTSAQKLNIVGTGSITTSVSSNAGGVATITINDVDSSSGITNTFNSTQFDVGGSGSVSNVQIKSGATVTNLSAKGTLTLGGTTPEVDFLTHGAIYTDSANFNLRGNGAGGFTFQGASGNDVSDSYPFQFKGAARLFFSPGVLRLANATTSNFVGIAIGGRSDTNLFIGTTGNVFRVTHGADPNGTNLVGGIIVDVLNASNRFNGTSWIGTNVLRPIANLTNITATTNSDGSINLTASASSSGGGVTYSPMTNLLAADGSNIWINAGPMTNISGIHASITLTNNFILNAPTNASFDGQVIRLRFVQDSVGYRTITTNGTANAWFKFGSDITGITLTTNSAAVDYLSFVYYSASSNWHPVSFIRGY